MPDADTTRARPAAMRSSAPGTRTLIKLATAIVAKPGSDGGAGLAREVGVEALEVAKDTPELISVGAAASEAGAVDLVRRAPEDVEGAGGRGRACHQPPRRCRCGVPVAGAAGATGRPGDSPCPGMSNSWEIAPSS